MPEDRARALVAPDHVALGDRIVELAGTPLHAVRPHWDFERSLNVWSRWHAQSGAFEATRSRFAIRTRTAGAASPLVTVCIVHYERPVLVRMAIDSVLAPGLPRFRSSARRRRQPERRSARGDQSDRNRLLSARLARGPTGKPLSRRGAQRGGSGGARRLAALRRRR